MPTAAASPNDETHYTLPSLDGLEHYNKAELIEQIAFERTRNAILQELKALREELNELKTNGIVKTTVVQHKASTMNIPPLQARKDSFTCL